MGVRSTSGGDYDLSNPLQSFVDTVRRVVFQPVGFFAGLPRRGVLLSPLIFALICTEISAILGGVLRLAGVGESFLAGYGIQVPENQGFGEFVGSVIFAPIGGIIGVFVIAGIAHLLVILVVGTTRSGFGATFRVASYTTVTSLVSWIPIIGWLLSLYGIYLSVVGIREMHGTTTGKAVLVVLIPVIVVVVLALLGLLVAGAVFFSGTT
ncbi:MAG TPA: YIP1 family protein [Rubrobacteraceae bacterium]|nr:YIP1 family protein [Rubrobacteraceae bacterium]